MHPEEIAGDLYLPGGIQFEAEWWMNHYEHVHKSGLILHGVDVVRVKKAQGRDLVG